MSTKTTDAGKAQSTAHSEGPWTCNDRGFVRDEGSRIIAQVGAVGTPDEAVSNGFLIAASPDLVEALARRAGIRVREGSALERITGDTPLIISHWQCRDEPGYKVRYFESDLGVFVHGSAGSWSGSYGNTLSIIDVERFAEDTLKKRPDLALSAPPESAVSNESPTPEEPA